MNSTALSSAKETPAEFAVRDAAWRALHNPSVLDESRNCKYSPALAFVLVQNPHGPGEIMLHPGEVERFITSAPFFSVSSVLVWEFSWGINYPAGPDAKPCWHSDRHLMHKTNATATLSKWDGTRHHYSIGYNGASGRTTWWENASFATVRNRH